jgi:catechol 2,3-dioxygenase-like lactoylglutathione lyase family enzyme
MTDDTVAPACVLHASLAVDDVDRSRSFYERVFDAEVVLDARDMTDLIRRTTGVDQLSCDLVQLRFASGGALLELIAFRGVPAGRQDDAPVRTGHGHVCLGVVGFDSALSRAHACGATALGEVVTYPEGRSVYLREPGGSVLELEEVES